MAHQCHWNCRRGKGGEQNDWDRGRGNWSKAYLRGRRPCRRSCSRRLAFLVVGAVAGVPQLAPCSCCLAGIGDAVFEVFPVDASCKISPCVELSKRKDWQLFRIQYSGLFFRRMWNKGTEVVFFYRRPVSNGVLVRASAQSDRKERRKERDNRTKSARESRS